jgi:hypothetical protein
MLVLVVSAVVSLMIVITPATGTGHETPEAPPRERIHLAKATDPASSPTPGTRPSPTWTGKPGGEIYHGTYSKDECHQRGEEGLAAQKWSAYSCKQIVNPEGLERFDKPVDVGIDTGLIKGDHALWVVDWLCMIRMAENCG